MRESSWHAPGTIVDDHKTAAAVLKAADLDWDVELRQTYVKDGRAYQPVENRFAVTRVTDGVPLGIVGRTYEPSQNKAAFAFMDEICKDGKATYEAAGSLNNGKIVYVMARMSRHIQIGDLDPIDLFLLFWNSHNGGLSVTAAITPIRVLCQNALDYALQMAQQSWKIRHTSGMEDRLAEAQASIVRSMSYADQWVEDAEALLQVSMSEAEFDIFLNALLSQLEFSERLEQDFALRARELFAEGETLDPIRGTRWAALNAVSEYSEHMRKGLREGEAKLKSTWRTNGKARRTRELAHTMLLEK